MSQKGNKLLQTNELCLQQIVIKTKRHFSRSSNASYYFYHPLEYLEDNIEIKLNNLNPIIAEIYCPEDLNCFYSPGPQGGYFVKIMMTIIVYCRARTASVLNNERKCR